MSRTGRPKKDICRNRYVKILLTECEKRELEEFAMLCHITESELVRQGITRFIDEKRRQYGLRKPEYDDYYDEMDYFEVDDDYYDD